MATLATRSAPIYTRPVFWLVAAVVMASVFLLNGDSGPLATGTTKPRRTARAANAGWDFPALDPGVHFAKPARPARNPFAPLVNPAKPTAAPKAQEDIVQVPSGLAGGEGGWAYTGMAEVDGVKMALLENNGSHQTGYVREGEVWKKTRVVAITLANIVLADEKGLPQTVSRFNPNDPPKAKPEPAGGFRPLDLTGPIGGIQIRPMPTPRATSRFLPGARK